MKRAILFLATLGLGGCYDSACSEPGTITMYWRFVGTSIPGLQQRIEGIGDVDDPATPNVDETGCSAAVVDEIEIHWDGGVERVPCDGVGNNGVPGARLPGFLRGTHALRVDAVRAGEVVFSRDFAADVRTCSDTVLDLDLAAVSNTTLLTFYDFNGAAPQACAGPGVQIANIEYELRDAANHTVETTCLAIDGSGNCVQFRANACNAEGAFYTAAALPHGRYAFAYVDAVDAQNTPVLSACNVPVVHDGFPVFTVNLTQQQAACMPLPVSPKPE